MFYSVDLLRLRNSKKGRLPKCWIAATIREFVGQGPTKISKKDIISFDIPAACDDVLERITTGNEKDRFSLYLSSQLTFGILKIFKKQTDFLFEHCEELFKFLTADKKKKSKKTRKSGDLDLTLEKEILSDPTRLFPKSKKDRFQINDGLDINQPAEIRFEFEDPIDLDCEVRSRNQWDLPLTPENREGLDGEEGYQGLLQFARHEMQETISEAQHEVPVAPSEMLHEVTETITNVSPIREMAPPITPSKRKSRLPHAETPTKRKRITETENFESPKTRSSTTLRFNESANVSEAARSPVTPVRRSIFQPTNEPVFDADVPMECAHEEIGSAALRAQENVSDQNISINFNVFAPPNADNDVSTSILTKSKSPQVVPEIDAPADIHAESPTVQVPANESGFIPPANVEFNLESLGESSSSLEIRKKKKRKQKILFDERKQIPIIFPAPSVALHTRPLESMRVILDQKIPAKILFTKPVSGSMKDEKKENYIFSSNICRWSKKLLMNFEKFTAKPDQKVHSLRETSMPLDEFVNKLPRRSSFRRENITSEKTVSSQSGLLQADTNELELPHDPNGSTRLSGINPPNDEPNQASPGIRRDPEFYPEPQIAEVEDYRDVPMDQPVFESDCPETDQTFLPKQSRALPYVSEEMEVSTVTETEPIGRQQKRLEENYIMSKTNFYEFLLKMWEIERKYLMDDEESIKIQLKHILNEDNSIQELYHYIFYCFEFEKKRKLYLKQKYAFDTVYIIQLGPESEDIAESEI